MSPDIYTARSTDDIYAHAEVMEAVRLCRAAKHRLTFVELGVKPEPLRKAIADAHRALGAALEVLGA